MGEEQTQAPPEMPEGLRPGEPDTYVTDPVKAEHMAHASKEQEQSYQEHNSSAQVHAHNMEGPSDWRAGAYAREHDLAQEARKDADTRADIAGDAYDKGYDVEIKPVGETSNDKPVSRLRRLGRRIVG